MGTLLLKGEWQAAVMLLMSPRPGDEMPDISAARLRYINDGAHGGGGARAAPQDRLHPCRRALAWR